MKRWRVFKERPGKRNLGCMRMYVVDFEFEYSDRCFVDERERWEILRWECKEGFASLLYIHAITIFEVLMSLFHKNKHLRAIS